MNPDPATAPAALDPDDRLLDLVGDALELPSGERAAFLAAACGEDEALLAEAMSLVQHGEQAGGEFLGRPAHGLLQGEDLGGLEAGSLPPGETLGECRVISLLGEGGMGEVYLAEDTQLGRRVAVKLLKRRLDDASLARRFRHERKILAALTHPNIARLYGGGVTPEGRSYLVMEYIEGERLDKFCETRKLGVNERLALFRKVCAAVTYAHQNLVVHRDLKPANIRVTPEGEPKLLDFGIAKLLDAEGDTAGARPDPSMTLQGAMTPEYASPEQLRGETITTVSDVYSLGVVLYELLCGQRPFAHLKGRRPDELARAICEEEPPRPSTVAGRKATTTTLTAATIVPSRQLVGDLDNVVAKALHKETARRYPSVLALSEDLRRYGEGLPVTARRDTPGYRAGKFVRRNKVGVAASVLVLLALLGGIAATSWQAQVARQERDRARMALANAEAAQRQSESARKQTQGINDFLQKLLGSASPTKLGKDAKVVQVLDAASATVDQTLASEPEVLAEVHQTLGTTYLSLGMQTVSEQHSRAALVLFRRLYGTEDERTVKAELFLAAELTHRNSYEEADTLLNHAASYWRQHLKGNEIALANVLSNLGFCSALMHRFAEADQELGESIALNASVLGENSLEYAVSLGQLGALKREEGQLDDAIVLLQRTRTIISKVAPNMMYMVVAELNLCFCLIEAGKFTDAETILEPLKQDCRRIAGENNNMMYTNVLFISELFDFQREDFIKVAEGGKEILDRFKAYLPKDELDSVTANYLLVLQL